MVVVKRTVKTTAGNLEVTHVAGVWVAHITAHTVATFRPADNKWQARVIHYGKRGNFTDGTKETRELFCETFNTLTDAATAIINLEV